MQILFLTPEISVAPQIDPGDLAAVAAAGFRAVINNRPDGEVSGQPSDAQMQAAAAASGLAYVFLPVISGGLQMSDVTDFGAAMAQLPKPVLAFCRSGTRSSTVWALSAVGSGADPAAVLAATRQAGYNLDPALLQAHAKS